MQSIPSVYTGGFLTDSLVNGLLKNQFATIAQGSRRVTGGDYTDEDGGGTTGKLGDLSDLSDQELIAQFTEGVTIGLIVMVVLNFLLYIWLIAAARGSWKLQGNDAIWVTLITLTFGPVFGLIAGYIFAR